MLCRPPGDQDSDARPWREYHFLDSTHQTALHARCVTGAVVIRSDVFDLLQENNRPRETRIRTESKIKNSPVEIRNPTGLFFNVKPLPTYFV